ncbi:hypothetical protein MMC13_004742 [Lambiella insularis]|nr:hypothetical protein [Lambiella insularis]
MSVEGLLSDDQFWYFLRSIVSLICSLPILALAVLFASSTPKGCKKIGIKTKSNLPYDGTQNTLDEAIKGNKPAVKALLIYPVKSTKFIELDASDVVDTGMQYDRQFSFAEMQNGQWKFVSQRTRPKLALVETELWVPDSSSWLYSKYWPEVQSGGVVIVRFPYRCPGGLKSTFDRCYATLTGRKLGKSLRLPFHPTEQQIRRKGYSRGEMKIWKDLPVALNMSNHLTDELQNELRILLDKKEITFALFRIAPHQERQVFRSAPRKEQAGYQPLVGFADAYPLHIMNTASVQDVNKRLVDSIPHLSILRFRPNIIIEGGLQPYEEDAWKRIRIGEFEYHVVCRTVRCKVPTNDPFTGVKHETEPEKTLKSYRMIDAGAPGMACLGMQMVPAAPESKIKVGDAIEVLERGEHCYIP